MASTRARSTLAPWALVIDLAGQARINPMTMTKSKPACTNRRAGFAMINRIGVIPIVTDQAGEMPRNLSERRRNSSIVVSNSTEINTRIVAAARIVGEISWRIPDHICLGKVS